MNLVEYFVFSVENLRDIVLIYISYLLTLHF